MLDFLKANTVTPVVKVKEKKVVIVPNITVQAQNRVKLSEEALSCIGHVEGNNIYIAKTIDGEGVVIASLPAGGGLGFPLNKNTTHFTNKGYCELLGGKGSTWDINVSEPVHQDEEGSVWEIRSTSEVAAITDEFLGEEDLIESAPEEETQEVSAYQTEEQGFQVR